MGITPVDHFRKELFLWTATIAVVHPMNISSICSLLNILIEFNPEFIRTCYGVLLNFRARILSTSRLNYWTSSGLDILLVSIRDLPGCLIR